MDDNPLEVDWEIVLSRAKDELAIVGLEILAQISRYSLHG